MYLVVRVIIYAIYNCSIGTDTSLVRTYIPFHFSASTSARLARSDPQLITGGAGVLHRYIMLNHTHYLISLSNLHRIFMGSSRICNSHGYNKEKEITVFHSIASRRGSEGKTQIPLSWPSVYQQNDQICNNYNIDTRIMNHISQGRAWAAEKYIFCLATNLCRCGIPKLL